MGTDLNLVPGQANRAGALADPTRLALLDVLREGRATVSEIASRLSLPADRLYHHLDVLEASGLVELAQLRPKRVYALAAELSEDGAQFSEKDRREILGAVFELARIESEAACLAAEPLSVMVNSLRLSRRQVEELHSRINELWEEYAAQQAKRGRRTRLIFGAIPLAEPR